MGRRLTVSTPSDGTSRVLLVDDHALVRVGTRLFLESYEDVEVVGEATDGAQALAQTLALRPDIVLMDLAMPTVDGVEATRRIKAAAPEVEVIVLTSFVEDDQVTAVIQAGAIGYVLKSADPADILAAIRAARHGEVHLDPAVARRLMRAMAKPKTQELAEPLTEREREVLVLLARGAANKVIAHELGVTEKTAKGHVGNILGKLGLTSRTQAVIFALRHNLVTLEDGP
jgi:NarL family two-component system response regulator LiaR